MCVNKGGVTNPLFIRLVGTEAPIPIKDILCKPSGISGKLGLFMTNRGAGINTVLLHHGSYFIKTNLNAVCIELMVNPRGAISSSTCLMRLDDMKQDLIVLLTSLIN